MVWCLYSFLVHGLHSESILASKVINIISMGEIKIPVSFIASGIVEVSCCCLNIKKSYFVFSNLKSSGNFKPTQKELSLRVLKETAKKSARS
jgi:hypothetical protein